MSENLMTPARLKQKRVLVTRPRERAEELYFLLEDEGAEVIALPLLELLPPADDRPLAAAAEQIHKYGWVVFASPSAAEALSDALRTAGTQGRIPELKVAVVGPRTAKAAKRLGFTVTLEPPLPTGEGLLLALRPFLSPGMEVLLPTAEEGRTELQDGLVELGVNVTRVVAYRSVLAPLDECVWTLLQGSPPDVVLFGSPRTVEVFLELGGPQAEAILTHARAVAIGPTTAASLREHGVKPATVAVEPTPAGLLEAAVRALEGPMRP